MSAGPDTPDILRRIMARKAESVAGRQRQVSATALEARLGEAPPVRGFRAALEARIGAGHAGVIAEVKKASPSKGVLREAFDPAAIAPSMAIVEAMAISLDTPPTELEPLVKRVDPMALDRLVSGFDDGNDRSLEFRYLDRRVTVRSRGVVEVAPPSDGD